MFFYRIKVSYKGTKFSGWQAQHLDSDKETHPTIQGQLQSALYRILRSKECRVSGSSRTDAGVHASSQWARINIPKKIDASRLLLGLNTELDQDIRILSCEECTRDFNPSYSDTRKEYHYYFCNDDVLPPVLSDTVSHFPGELNYQKMNEAMNMLVGKHDFRNFYMRSSEAVSTEREIYTFKLVNVIDVFTGAKLFRFEIIGDGFLKQMIRIIVNAIYQVGRGRLAVEDVRSALQVDLGKNIYRSAAPNGLHLIDVDILRTKERKIEVVDEVCEL